MARVCRPIALALLLAALFLPVAAQQNPEGRLPLGNVGNPLIFLLRDEEVLRQLDATAAQREALAALADEIDRQVWPARNQPQEASQKVWESATERAQARARELLEPEQRQRVEQIILQIQGIRSLARSDVAQALELTAEQTSQIEKIVAETQERVEGLYRRAASGEPIGPLEEEERNARGAEQRRISEVLSEPQRQGWVKLAGKEVDLSRLGRVTFAAPELVASADSWLDPKHAATTLADRVTAVHFFANGCINCQRNYPHYVRWQKELTPKGLQIVGIHTPEFDAERDIEQLRKRAAEAGLDFPILIDNDRQNWNAWGNSMWPSVYLVDRRGRIRAWWYGELNWQGAEGEKRIRERIEELLAEDSGLSRAP